MSEVSKIKLQDGSEFQLKDTELRKMIKILLGEEEPIEDDKRDE